MPSLEINTLQAALKGFDDAEYKTFVETGTFQGETIFRMEPLFESLITIELDPSLHAMCRRRYQGSKIEFILGDTTIALQNLVPRLLKPVVFFLDAHYSGGITECGEKHCPLLDEVAIISAGCLPAAIVIIDDFRLFGKGPNQGCEENWLDISKESVLDLVCERLATSFHLPSVLHPKDRFVLVLRTRTS
jgi:hypothetical protein